MLPNDFFKLIFQNSHGPHHLDIKKLEENYYNELNILSTPPSVPYEYIGNNYYRIYLNVHWSDKIRKQILDAFIKSNLEYEPNETLFFNEINLLDSMIKNDDITLDYNLYINSLNQYKKQGFGMLSHSSQYKSHYNPHYILINKKHLNELLLLL